MHFYTDLILNSQWWKGLIATNVWCSILILKILTFFFKNENEILNLVFEKSVSEMLKHPFWDSPFYVITDTYVKWVIVLVNS